MRGVSCNLANCHAAVQKLLVQLVVNQVSAVANCPATKSYCRQRLTICAINYSGRASELGGVFDFGPVYHALSVHLSRAKLITRFDDRYAVAKFSKSEL